MTNLQCFSFQSNEIRIVVDDNGNLWYVAKDVAEALGYQWAGIRNVQHVPEEWRGVESVSTPSGTQEMWCLSEQGLYFFLGRSDKPLAVPFQKWLAGDVVPSIRRTGSYGAPSAPVIDGDYLIRIGQEMNRLNQQLVVAEAKVKEMAPKARFADAVSETRNNMLIGTLAKILNDNGYPTGRACFV